MVTLLFILMMISGFVFVGSILLMTPKGGLGFGVGGMATSNEYGSKKSLQGALTKSAVFSIVIFILSSMVYPYMAKKDLSTKKVINQSQTNNIQIVPEKVNGKAVSDEVKVINATNPTTGN